MSNRAAVIGAILYTFSTYRTIDAFTRFAMGEYLAMTFFAFSIFLDFTLFCTVSIKSGNIYRLE